MEGKPGGDYPADADADASMISGPTLRKGTVEVIAGSMFSGKTGELIRLLRHAQYARLPIQVFKPSVDNRYSDSHLASHDKSFFPSTSIDNAADIFQHLRVETRVIGIDEGQFFDDELVDVVEELANRGLRVIVAGLDLNWKGEPFHPMPALMAIAEKVKKLSAVCVVCGAPGTRTQRLIDRDETIVIGDRGSYESRCRDCFNVPHYFREGIYDSLEADQADR